MKTVLITITVLILNLTTFGQHQFGIKINGGVSRITRMEKNNSPYKAYLKLSGYSGLFYNFKFGKNSYVGIDALLMQIQGHEHLEAVQTIVLWSGNLVDTWQSEYYREMTYLGFPIYYGLNFKKISLNLGIQASLLVRNMFDGEGKSQISGQSPTTWKGTRSSSLGTGNIDLGARI